jgi:hypothetical protein
VTPAGFWIFVDADRMNVLGPETDERVFRRIFGIFRIWFFILKKIISDIEKDFSMGFEPTPQRNFTFNINDPNHRITLLEFLLLFFGKLRM